MNQMYTWAKLKLIQCENGVWELGLCLSKYVQEALRNCNKYVEENFLKL